VKFISPKELFISTYGDGFNVYHCDFNRRFKQVRGLNEDTNMDADQKAKYMRPAR
jgi:hypothetical protein